MSFMGAPDMMYSDPVRLLSTCERETEHILMLQRRLNHALGHSLTRCCSILVDTALEDDTLGASFLKKAIFKVQDI